MIIYPLIGVILPLTISLPIANKIKGFDNTSKMRSIIIYGPPISSFFWLIVLYFGIKGRRIMFTVTSYICIFFVIPFGFLLPLYDIKAFGKNQKVALSFFILLVTVAGISLLILVLYKLLKIFGSKYFEIDKSKPSLSLYSFFRSNIENFGLFGNGIGFCCTLIIQVYAIHNRPEKANQKMIGAIPAFCVIISGLFLV